MESLNKALQGSLPNLFQIISGGLCFRTFVVRVVLSRTHVLHKIRKRDKSVVLSIAVYSLLTAKMTYYMETSEGDRETGEWRRIHSEELDVFYTSLNIIRVIKSE